MATLLVFSLPMVIVFIFLCFASYLMGRNKGRQEGRALAAQEFGINLQPQAMGPVVDGVMATGNPPPPPPPYQPYPAPAAFPSPTPHATNPHYMKQQNGMVAV